MSEAKFTTRWQKWARKNIQAPAIFEIKSTKKDYLPFSAIRPHQKHFLLSAIGENSITWKIPDSGIQAKPCDVIMVGFMDAYVVIDYPQGFVVIGADHFFNEEKRSTRKSLTYERAQSIATYTGKC